MPGTSSTVVHLAGYAIDSQNGTIDVDGFNGLGDTEDDWVVTGLALPTGVQELNSNGDPVASTPISNLTSFSLGMAYDPIPALQAAGLGVDIEQNDLSLIYYDTILDETFNGVVEYLGEKSFNNIGIVVDLATGTASLKNDSMFDQTITGYLIEANTPGTLNTNQATFDGVRDEPGGSGFQAPANLDGENLGELDPTGAGILLAAGQAYSLGTIGGRNNDLTLSFLPAGIGQESRPGFVQYLNAGIQGDFNNDGRVDAADYTVWRNNMGAANESAINFNGDGNGISASDYTLWKANFGMGVGGALISNTTANVPEPNSILLVVAGLAMGMGAGKRTYPNRQQASREFAIV